MTPEDLTKRLREAAYAGLNPKERFLARMVEFAATDQILYGKAVPWSETFERLSEFQVGTGFSPVVAYDPRIPATYFAVTEL